MEQNHIEGMARLAMGPAGKAMDLPGGIKFAVGYGEASVNRGRPISTSPPALEGCHRLNVPGKTALPGWETRIDLSAEGHETQESNFIAFLSRRALGDEVWVRSRRPGDRLQPLGMTHQKKLQDLMVDCKIPRNQRDNIPLLVTPRGIAWVVGWRIADWAKVAEGESDNLLVQFTQRS